jgi:hypothetical protein
MDTSLYLEGEITKTNYISGTDTLYIMDSVRFRTNDNEYSATLLFAFNGVYLTGRTFTILEGTNKGTSCLVNCPVSNVTGSWSKKDRQNPSSFIPTNNNKEGKSNRTPKIVAESGTFPIGTSSEDNVDLMVQMVERNKVIIISTFDFKDDFNLSLMTIEGKELGYHIVSKSGNQLIIKPESINSGQYILTLTNGNETLSRAFIFR